MEKQIRTLDTLDDCLDVLIGGGAIAPIKWDSLFMREFHFGFLRLNRDADGNIAMRLWSENKETGEQEIAEWFGYDHLLSAENFERVVYKRHGNKGWYQVYPKGTFFTLAEADNKEKDPHGKNQHEAGAKLDAGKNRMALMLSGFANALTAIGEVATYGAQKYTPDGWMVVDNGIERYSDAMMRHWFALQRGETVDTESGQHHMAHFAWNALAVLELMERERKGGL